MQRTRGLVGGFTLLELLVTLAVGSILIAMAVPNFRDVMLNSQRTASVNDLVAAMTMARIEAQKQGRQVIVCPLDTTSACTPATANWNNGWLVYVNRDATSPPVFDANDVVVKRFPRKTAPVTARGNQNYFAFRVSPGQNVAGTVTFCDSRGAGKGRAVVVGLSGKIRTATEIASCTP